MAKLDVSGGSATGSDAAGNVMQNLAQSAASSMEQFISPVRIEKGHPAGAQTPGFLPPSVSDEDGKYGDDAVGPTIEELDPYFPTILNDGTDDGSEFMKENDYRFLVNDKVTKTSGDFNLRKLEDENAGSREAISVVRPMSALRGPMIMSGWGFGMDDLPVPAKNNGTGWPQRGQFDDELVHDRALWKTGPVHLMWDEERQVWQGGYPIVCGVVDGAITAPADVCTPTTFTVNLFRNTQHLGGKLSDVTGETITVQNRDPSLEQEAVANAVFCMAIKLNYEWLPLWVGCPETPACGGDGEPSVPPCVTNSSCA
tara:strand:+ start:3372 stop:4310 length:939 start_codon:yes stop_codon:yes gene_type:complete